MKKYFIAFACSTFFFWGCQLPTDSSNNNNTNSDTTYTITFPNRGEKFVNGDTLIIAAKTIDASQYSLKDAQYSISFDGGITWVDPSWNYSSNRDTAKWVITDSIIAGNSKISTQTTSGKIRILHSSKNEGVDYADKLISIGKRQSALKVVSQSIPLISTEYLKLENSDKIRQFLGNKNFKVAICQKERLFILQNINNTTSFFQISRGDEAFDGRAGEPVSPIFSADGKRIIYADGSMKYAVSYIQQVVDPGQEAWRIPVFAPNSQTADPHWYIDNNNETWVYMANSPNSAEYDIAKGKLSGLTYKVKVINDSTISPLEISELPGAFKGGFSKDGKWALASYTHTVLYDRQGNTFVPFIFSNDSVSRFVQHCNPSMNPFSKGALRSDYLMLLGFGNLNEKTNPTRNPYSLISVGKDTLFESMHQNIWMFNKDKKVVWQCERTDKSLYRKWERPEWSTHPRFATAIQVDTSDTKGDLYIIRIEDLSSNDETRLKKPDPAQDFLKIGSNLSSTSTTHLWVEP